MRQLCTADMRSPHVTGVHADVSRERICTECTKSLQQAVLPKQQTKNYVEQISKKKRFAALCLRMRSRDRPPTHYRQTPSVCVLPPTTVTTTSNAHTYLKFKFLKWKCTSTIPVVFTRVLSISCSVGMQSFAPKRSSSSKKLQEKVDMVDCVHESLTVPNHCGAQQGTVATHNSLAMSTSSPIQRKQFCERKADTSTAKAAIVAKLSDLSQCTYC